MRVDQATCTGCGYCLLICPFDAIANKGVCVIDSSACTDCNVCVSACPNGCFQPDRPPRERESHYAERYDVAIIGSGIGGLMAAAALACAGRQVVVFEQLSFLGGRYTELDYHGYSITTGAWTPPGPNSNIGRFLAAVGAEVGWTTLADLGGAGKADLFHIQFADGRYFRSMQEVLGRHMRAYALALATGRREPPTDVSTRDFMARFIADADVLAAIDANICTASGLHADAVPASEYIHIVMDMRAAGDTFGYPRGGPRAIITALEKVVKAHGGTIFTRSPVERIVVKDGAAVGLVVGGQTIAANVVIHNGGVWRLRRLVGDDQWPTDYGARLRALKGVDCAALVIGTREPLFAGTSMLLTPGSQRVVGIFAPTFFDPSVAPAGRYMIDAFFPLESPDWQTEMALAMADLRRLFPRLDGLMDICVPMYFRGTWTGAETGQTFGQVGDNRLPPRTPIANLYLVGMDVQGSGAAGDLIPVGVNRLLAQVQASAMT